MARFFNGPLRKNPINPRYFTDDSGNAIYLTGSHNWSVMNDMWLEGDPKHEMDYPAFLQMMQDYGHNFLRFWQFHMQTKCAPWNKRSTLFYPQPFLRTGPGLAADGKPKFDLTKPNPEYYERLRKRVEMAGEKGIYVSVMLFEAWAFKWATPDQNPWLYHPFHPNNNINGVDDDPCMPDGRAWKMFSLQCPKIFNAQKEYIKKVIDCLNDLDHVLYEVCNEIPHTKEAMEWQEEICRFIRSYESTLSKQHMIGITAEGGDQDNRELFATSADWISPSNGEIFEYRYNPPAADGSKVILNDTDHLWGHGCDINWIWKSFTRGHNVLFMDPWEPIPGDLDWWQDGDVTRNQRYYYLWDDARRNLGYTRRVALEFNLNYCVPSNHLCTSTYCLAWEGQQYICFFPAGGSEGLDLRKAEGTFRVEWLNPRTGVTYKGGTVNGGQRQALTAPFEGSAVLFVYKNKNQLKPRYEIYHS